MPHSLTNKKSTYVREITWANDDTELPPYDVPCPWTEIANYNFECIFFGGIKLCLIYISLKAVNSMGMMQEKLIFVYTMAWCPAKLR